MTEHEDQHQNINDESCIRRGPDAQLEGIRTALSSSSDQREALLSPALEAFGSGTTNALLHQGPARLSWQSMGAAVDNDTGSSSSSVEGYLFVTQEACLFVGGGNSDACTTTASSNNDWYVPATALTLHALAEQEGSVYVQMENNGANDEDETPIEWTIAVDDAQAVYQALTDLVSAWPIDPHEDTNNSSAYEEVDGKNFEPEDMIWASGIVAAEDGDKNNPDETKEATEEERQAMLDRLDQVLTVPPELEIKDASTTEGQFDDAEEEEDEINNLL